jgi:hypothetical protein
MNRQSTLEKECVNWDEIKDLPESDLIPWPVYDGRKVKAVKINGKYRLIDLEISGLIEDLNKAGHETEFCCAGHEDSKKDGICRGYISFENTRENQLFISFIAHRRIENTTPINALNSELLIEPPCVIRLHYNPKKRKEVLENFIKLFYDKTGNIISI